MKRPFLNLFLVAAAATVLTACHDDDKVSYTTFDFHETPYAYFLCEGAWGQNNAGISYLLADATNKLQVHADLYEQANEGRILGDLANDMMMMNNRLYVVVSGSRYVAKLDDRGRELARHSFTADEGEPRYCVSIDGQLYVTLYGGTVAVLDTTALDVQKTYPVGDHPEQLTYIYNHLVVCNTGHGAGHSLSVINLATGSTRTVETAQNPTCITRIAAGYAGLFKTTSYDADWTPRNTVWMINPTNDWRIDSLTTASHILPLSNESTLLLDQTVDYTTTPASYQNTFRSYNVVTDRVDVLNNRFSIDLSAAPIYMLSLDWRYGDIYVATAESNGDGSVANSRLYRFDFSGQHKQTFNDAGGVFMSRGVYHDVIEFH